MTVTVEAAKVSLPNDRTVKVVRAFDAPRALVYRAYTEPALVRRWMLGPPGWTMPVCEMDVRAGGTYRWRWRSDEDGKEFGFSGVFREVAAPAKLVHTQVYDPGDVGGDMGGEALIVVELVETSRRTTVTSTMDFGSRAARDAAMATGMTDGMEASNRLLDRLVLELA